MRRAKAAIVMRRQPRITAKGGGAAMRASGARLYGRRSVVKASFRRNRGNGAWVRHARYLTRESAQREAARGRSAGVVFHRVARGCGTDRFAAARPGVRGGNGARSRNKA